MSHTFTCDWCGDAIADDAGYVTLSAKASSESSWTAGWVGHYHSDNGGQSCFGRFRDAIGMAHKWGQAVESLAVAEKPTRTRFTLPNPPRRVEDGTLLYRCGISPGAAHSLSDAGLTFLEEVAQRTEAEIASVKGVGGVTMQKLRAELSKAGLSFRQVEGVTS